MAENVKPLNTTGMNSPQTQIYLFHLYFSGNAVRVGGERDGSTVRQLTYKVKGKDVPVIPNTSWKGVFKRISEDIARGKKMGTASSHKNDEHRVNEGNKDPNAESKIHLIENKVIQKLTPKDGIYKGEDLKVLEIDDELWQIIRSNLSPNDLNVDDFMDLVRMVTYSYMCPVDRTYGSHFFASAITFSDSLMENSISFQPHVMIDRVFGGAKESRLYEEEVVDPSSLSLKVILRPEGDLPLWRYTLKYVEKMGIAVGGSKSRGLGHLTLDVEKSEFALVDGLSVNWRPLKEFLK